MTGTNLHSFQHPTRGSLFQKGEEVLSPEKQVVSLAELYPVLLLKNDITSSKAESQCRKSFQMVQRCKLGLKTSVEILEANYEVHRNGRTK